MKKTENNYYICDYAGHYYKLNEKDNLVAAKNKTEAALFSFEEAKSRIGTGRKASFYKICEVENSEPEKKIEPSGKEKDKLASVIIPPINFDSFSHDWVATLEKFCYMHDHINEYRKNLYRGQSYCDKAITDIHHDLELSDLNDQEKINDATQLQEYLRYRRIIKDEIEKTSIMKQRFLDDKEFNTKVQNVIHELNRMNNRQYTPRVLYDLFQK